MPNLAAKDIIDVQITVTALDPTVAAIMVDHGYPRVERITGDHRPPTDLNPDEQWRKWFFKPTAAQRPVNIHMRLTGHANQRYALLFRDYLRAHPLAAEAYAQVKRALAQHDNADEDFYYDVKDPVCDIIMTGAEECARTGWQLGASDAYQMWATVG
ncbi:MAG: GrpB family protein [Caldilineaceae bacterium]